MEGSFSSESITYKSFPRLGHLVLHVDEVQVVVDAAAKVAVLGAYYLQIRTSVWAPSPACRRSPGGGGRRCQGSFSSEFFFLFLFFVFFVSFSSESITYKSSRRLGTWSCMSTTFRWWRTPLPRLLFLEPITYTSSPRLGHLGTWNM